MKLKKHYHKVVCILRSSVIEAGFVSDTLSLKKYKYVFHSETRDCYNSRCISLCCYLTGRDCFWVFILLEHLIDAWLDSTMSALAGKDNC